VTPETAKTIRALGWASCWATLFCLGAIFAAVKEGWGAGSLLLLGFVSVFGIASIGTMATNALKHDQNDSPDNGGGSCPADPSPPSRSRVPDYLPGDL
jgi:hypothetical protein